MMTTAGRALRNAIDLLASLPAEEAEALGREMYQEMGYMNVADVLRDVTKTVDMIDKGAVETLPK